MKNTVGRLIFLELLILLSVGLVGHAQASTANKGFTRLDYENSLRTGATMTPIDTSVLESFENTLNSMPLINQADAPVSPNIISGTNAIRGEFSQYTLVLITDRIGNIVGLCGGTLIAQDRVLTAAHCAQEDASRYYLLPGFHSFSDPIRASDFVRVSSVAVHPMYNETSLDYDIGILKLSRYVAISPAKVHIGSNEFVDEVGTVIGVGLISTQPNRSPNTLQKVLAPIVSNRDCNATWLQDFGVSPITPRMMCAGFSDNGKGSCNGDSGGPLWSNVNGEPIIVGTVSFGRTTCELQRGNQGYARLSTMQGFLQQHSPDTTYVKSNESLPFGILMLLTDEPVEKVSIKPEDLLPPIPNDFEGKFFVHLEAEDGYVIEGGTSYKYTQQNSNLEIELNDFAGLRISFRGWGDVVGSPLAARVWTWNMDYRYHPNHTRIKNLRVTQAPKFRNCGFEEEYKIHELSIENGKVTKLVADFFQTCGATVPKLKGSIYYDASAPDAEYVRPVLPDVSVYPELPELQYRGAVAKLVDVPSNAAGPLETHEYSTSNSSFYTRAAGLIGSDARQGFVFSVSSSDRDWSLWFRRGSLEINPDNNLPAQVGFYAPTLNSSEYSLPAHSLGGFGIYRDCDDLSGDLNIIDYEQKPSTEIVRIKANFSLSCGDTPDVTTYGSFHYDSTLPLPPR
jgi:trypsin